MTDIIKPPAGQKVRITAMPGGYANGHVGFVSDDYNSLTPSQIGVKVDDLEAPAHQNGCWIVDGWEPIYPAIGDKIIPLPDNGLWHGISEEYRNAVGTVTEVSDPGASGRRLISAEFQSHQKPDDTTRWSFYWCTPADGHTLTVSTDEGREAASEIQTLKAEITRLENLANERERTITRLNETISQAHRGFSIASEVLTREANDRSWCEVYDNVIDEINGLMPGPFRFEEREDEYEIEVEISATVRYTTSVTVTARNQDQAYEMVNDDPESYIDDAESILHDNFSYADVNIDSIDTK